MEGSAKPLLSQPPLSPSFIEGDRGVKVGKQEQLRANKLSKLPKGGKVSIWNLFYENLYFSLHIYRVCFSLAFECKKILRKIIFLK